MLCVNTSLDAALTCSCTLTQHGPRGERELRFYELVKELAEECTPDLGAALAALDPFASTRPGVTHRSRLTNGAAAYSLVCQQSMRLANLVRTLCRHRAAAVCRGC